MVGNCSVATDHPARTANAMARILALDQNPAILDIYEQVLAMDGHEVHLASRLGQAVNILHDLRVDAILTDLTATTINGPTGDGLQQLVDAAPDAALIVVTGYGGRQELQTLADRVDDV